MRLDATDLRYITNDEFRVLTACEMGSKNHEVVPSSLINQISGLRAGGANKMLGVLAKRNLVARVQNAKYDGYRLTYGGYDYLALRAMSKRDTVYSVGNQIGVGKESDIYVVANQDGEQRVLKLHRLGRVSFRAIKNKRDYLGKRKSASWMYMSRLSAQKEYAFMQVLHKHGFPVPTPIDQARHTVLMSLEDALPLRSIAEVEDPAKLCSQLFDLIVKLAEAGLVHGDFNEFNILIRSEDEQPVLIDFPQMVSVSHPNAEEYFDRDVHCILKFFDKRFRYQPDSWPEFEDVVDKSQVKLLSEVMSNGFGAKEQSMLDQYTEDIAEEEEGSDNEDDDDEEDSNKEENEEDEDDESSSVDEDEDQSDESETVDDGVKKTTNLMKPMKVDSRRKNRERNADDESTMAEKVALDLHKQSARTARKHHGRKSTREAGKAKGHKWKNSECNLKISYKILTTRRC
ncbi:RIO1-domain-containing protein [Wallemia mellicola]|uniref:Serine/threonine-protein kinase RIO2 n=1 Tax=Wallemia mellicola TaxID=1708541 RepID=A0A4V4MSD9_9BASI|nr:RIO1-domain-containing protein [Wallemia mellicola]TIC15810.1 RIO1-domain-containing protein [Wallemia mellicola]TIC21953.1 RIO1-domain-containing protein [Wallemia mellicola]TIC34086.1 RIO1-domain-containing protein [Wallemia mellicola]TIC41748.1 RIO1-domain-containing protein [Wallemia mellicola]